MASGSPQYRNQRRQLHASRDFRRGIAQTLGQPNQGGCSALRFGIHNRRRAVRGLEIGDSGSSLASDFRPEPNLVHDLKGYGRSISSIDARARCARVVIRLLVHVRKVLGRDPFDGSAYVFRNRSGSRLKVLYGCMGMHTGSSCACSACARDGSSARHRDPRDLHAERGAVGLAVCGGGLAASEPGAAARGPDLTQACRWTRSIVSLSNPLFTSLSRDYSSELPLTEIRCAESQRTASVPILCRTMLCSDLLTYTSRIDEGAP